jgi:hypothetical protein
LRNTAALIMGLPIDDENNLPEWDYSIIAKIPLGELCVERDWSPLGR